MSQGKWLTDVMVDSGVLAAHDLNVTLQLSSALMDLLVGEAFEFADDSLLGEWQITLTPSDPQTSSDSSPLFWLTSAAFFGSAISN